MTQPHECQDMQMFVRLGHDPVVGSHHEDDHIHAMRARYHVADEIHVARHIHDPHDPVVGQPARSKAQVDRQAAPLLLRKRVGFAAGEQLDEGAFAVIDVPGRAEHDVLSSSAHALFAARLGFIKTAVTERFSRTRPQRRALDRWSACAHRVGRGRLQCG